MFHLNVCRWLDSNRRPLGAETTALPTAPQPLPQFSLKCYLDSFCVSDRGPSSADGSSDAQSGEGDSQEGEGLHPEVRSQGESKPDHHLVQRGKNTGLFGVAAIAPWFRLRLPSCGPGFDPKHTIYAFFNYWNCNEKMTKINKKRPGLAHF